MDDSLQTSIQQRAELLLSWFDSTQRYAVAFSGGVDSAVVAVAAMHSGAESIAVTSRSPSVRRQDIDDAKLVAERLGLRHVWIDTQELQSSEYQRNDSRRCFHCKTHLFTAIASRYSDRVILSGTNFDDLGDYRPGLEAAERFAVKAPLVELGIGKLEVRNLAHYWQISVADKPASPCLASRLAYGVSVSSEKLAMVQAAEQVLYELLNLKDCRVRLHADSLARIEVQPEEFSRVIQPETRKRILAEFCELGFQFVTFDLAGQRSGSLNAVLPLETIQVRNANCLGPSEVRSR